MTGATSAIYPREDSSRFRATRTRHRGRTGPGEHGCRSIARAVPSLPEGVSRFAICGEGC